ncbi:unnamed protein product [Adineta ricciae]|uniref:G-protein coupled receptors family 1 profile domain-containing protein n=1 Tax=Adineta ricciae TaxID=249248 RepID=A0A813ZVE1_ADIRI|nr:unnamed protein product [Adineta ricciae]
MSSFADLTGHLNNDQSSAIAHGLLKTANQSGFTRTISSLSYNTNWSISHIPGPPLFQTSSFASSLLLSLATSSSSSSSSSILTTAAIDTTESKYYPFWLLVVIAVFGSVTSVLTVLGNILVILAFFLDRQIRQPTNYFILSLSVSDFLIGLLSMPLLTIYIYSKEWPLNAIICDIWLSLDYTVCLTSIYTVLFITIDRFCSVKMPAKYRKWRTGRKINIMITITWAVPCLIFFTATMVYPRLKGISNLQNGVCVASNLERKSRENARKMSSLVGNAMTHIGAGIGVSKSPAKTSVDKQNHLTRKKIDSTVCDDCEDEDPQNLLAHNIMNTQNSSNSSDQRRAGGGDDDNSNSFESHSDFDFNRPTEKQIQSKANTREKTSRQNNRRGMSANWGSGSSNPVNVSSTVTNNNRTSRSNRGQANQKHGSNVKFFATSMAQSLYKAPIRLSAFSSASKPKGSNSIPNKSTPHFISNQQQTSNRLASIPSEPELATNRVHPPPQPRPESLAIMSDELFHEKLKARQSPLFLTSQTTDPPPSLSPPQLITIELPSTSSFLVDNRSNDNLTQCLPTDQTLPLVEDEEQQENLIDISMKDSPQDKLSSPIHSIKTDKNGPWCSPSNNTHREEHIPFIDETDFEDLGYILHRRRVPAADSNEPIHEETIVYKSPFYIRHKHRAKASVVSLNNTTNENGIDRKIYEIYGNHEDAHKVLLESPMYDSVELITYPCQTSDSSPIRHCSLRNVPCEALLKTISKPVSPPTYSSPFNDCHTTSSIIFVSKARTTISPSTSSLTHRSVRNSSSIQNADVERALIDFYQCSQINDVNDCLLKDTDSNVSDDLEISLSNYNEICEEASSLLRLNEQQSSAFIDDESSIDDFSMRTKSSHPSRYSNSQVNQNNQFMKMMVLNKTRQNLNMDTTSDERTTTNSFSLNTYSQDFSVDKIFQYDSSTSSYRQPRSQTSWCSSSSATTSSSCQNPQIPLLLLGSSSPQHLLAATEKKRNTSSDSDGITTTTSLTNSTQFGSRRDSDNNKDKSRDSITQDVLRAFNKTNATTITDELEIESTEHHVICPLRTKLSERGIKCHSLADTITRDNDTSGYGSHDDPPSSNNRASSKVTFESIVIETSAPSSPKTKDQCVMAQIDVQIRQNNTNNNNTNTQEQIQDVNENKNGLIIPITSDVTTTNASITSKSSVRELVRSQKNASHRKSKSQNRARKALRTITFILGAFVVCWTPWHIYSAIHSLCDSCKNSWVFGNPMFHCFYFLCYLNSPINPFCYALANQQFKKTFTRILKLDLRRL